MSVFLFLWKITQQQMETSPAPTWQVLFEGFSAWVAGKGVLLQ